MTTTTVEELPRTYGLMKALIDDLAAIGIDCDPDQLENFQDFGSARHCNDTVVLRLYDNAAVAPLDMEENQADVKETMEALDVDSERYWVLGVNWAVICDLPECGIIQSGLGGTIETTAD